MIHLSVFSWSKLSIIAWIFVIFPVITGGCTISYSSPPLSLEKSDLIGTWEAKYSKDSTDRIILGENSFQQVYRDQVANFVVTDNEWRLERLPSGFVRIYLPGAQYYAGA